MVLCYDYMHELNLLSVCVCVFEHTIVCLSILCGILSCGDLCPNISQDLSEQFGNVCRSSVTKECPAMKQNHAIFALHQTVTRSKPGCWLITIPTRGWQGSVQHICGWGTLEQS